MSVFVEKCYPHLKWGLLYRASSSLVLDSFALLALEDAAVKIRFIDVCHSCNASELTMTIFAVCRYVHCMYASRIESFLYVPWISNLQRLTSISETEPHLAVLNNHPQFPEVIVIKVLASNQLYYLFLLLKLWRSERTPPMWNVL